jgi:S1-C subfamily serine protease
VQDPSEVQLAVDRGRVGQDMPIVVERDGERVELMVKPEELPRQQ